MTERATHAPVGLFPTTNLLEETMRSKHAREIGPFRLSGHNPRPLPAAAPASAEGTTVSLGTPSASRRLRERLDATTGMVLGDPPRVRKDEPCSIIFISGVPVRVPVGWSAAVGHSKHGDSLYIRNPQGRVHVLTVNDDGEVRELQNLPADFLRDIEQSYLPRRAR